jgi:ribose 5-phosphate isomerase B
MKHTEKIIAIGADHRGFYLKQFLIQSNMIQERLSYPVKWIDVGTHTQERVDYPCFAVAVCDAILDKQADLGVLICGTGLGMAIAANRFKGIYAGVFWNPEIARLGRQDDNINVAVLPADFIDQLQTIEIVVTWLESSFKEDHYAQRLAIVDCLP